MTLIPETTDKRPQEWHTRLFEALKKHGLNKKVSLVLSLQEFQALLKTQDASLITKVLDWYCGVIGQDYIPRVTTAKQFRMRFADLHAAMLRNTTEEVGNWARSITKQHLEGKTWPPEIAANLPAIVQRTQINWDLFFVKLTNHKNNLPNTFIRFALGQSWFFTNDWIEFLHKEHGWKQHFIGDPMSLAFKPTSKRFKDSFWAKWSQDYCGKANGFDDLFRELIKNDTTGS